MSDGEFEGGYPEKEAIPQKEAKPSTRSLNEDGWRKIYGVVLGKKGPRIQRI